MKHFSFSSFCNDYDDSLVRIERIIKNIAKAFVFHDEYFVSLDGQR